MPNKRQKYKKPAAERPVARGDKAAGAAVKRGNNAMERRRKEANMDKKAGKKK